MKTTYFVNTRLPAHLVTIVFLGLGRYPSRDTERLISKVPVPLKDRSSLALGQPFDELEGKSVFNPVYPEVGLFLANFLRFFRDFSLTSGIMAKDAADARTETINADASVF